MLNTFLIFLGAGLGGVMRYWVSNVIYWITGRQFPFGTLVVNVSGSFLMGLLFVLIIERFGEMSTSLRALLLIGLLGGYTTFSSFSLETLTLLESGAWLSGLLNILLSVFLCMFSVWIGVLGARQL